MKLQSKDLNSLCNIAIEAAKTAGQYISDNSQKKFSIMNKSEGKSDKERSIIGNSLAAQVVTEVDLKSQEIILKILAPTINEYDLALLTEESTDDRSRMEKDYFWCIDPMDGTLSFIENIPGYSVSIALVSREGISQIGVVYDPVNKTLFQAIKGEGVFKNEKPWTPKHANIPSNQTLTFFIDRSFLNHPDFDFVISKLEDIAKKMNLSQVLIKKGAGAVMNACMVLENRPACYFRFPKVRASGGSLWDFAASACIVKEAGGLCSDIFGNPLDLNRPDSLFMNHRGVLYTDTEELANMIKNIYLFIKDT